MGLTKVYQKKCQFRYVMWTSVKHTYVFLLRKLTSKTKEISKNLTLQRQKIKLYFNLFIFNSNFIPFLWNKIKYSNNVIWVCNLYFILLISPPFFFSYENSTIIFYSILFYIIFLLFDSYIRLLLILSSKTHTILRLWVWNFKMIKSILVKNN
jgi:hypothetical protein